jgi:hypothetical protein
MMMPLISLTGLYIFGIRTYSAIACKPLIHNNTNNTGYCLGGRGGLLGQVIDFETKKSASDFKKYFKLLIGGERELCLQGYPSKYRIQTYTSFTISKKL